MGLLIIVKEENWIDTCRSIGMWIDRHMDSEIGRQADRCNR